MATPYYEDAWTTLYCGDCREVLQALAAPCADVVIADPPYNVGKPYLSHDDRMEPPEYRAWLRTLLRAWARHTRGSLVYFPGTKNVWWAAEELVRVGLRPRRMLGWHRKEFAGDNYKAGPPFSWEPIIWASTVEKPRHNTIYGTQGRDFLVVPSTHGDPDCGPHPCPKPLAVMRWLVGLFAPPHGTVLDPVAGTGRTLQAAKAAGVRSIGVEIEEAYCEIAAKRLAQEVLWRQPR